ncbi:autotransporter assembly complex protein TamA [Blochmannia endosymbiont of Polyrhachis (Hedomyrma) turneri]|uniref:autotransporter assembly complex protein TamA n=1 Tax=Blochmannia endosymbiont of Polyrhachis (Hedomyrma) turneri TaxID=1505596 RepID=UPI00061A60DE|nr:autotransporter assembly complex family protein [Blochmannia endosymbiont of Polyrhachis (Hedomyrma) turneri]AKC59675.1 Uncharacterized protein ytfM [Blochmannia endosymbiont of Polyrhachis (Hedomyrma) turneri]
MLILKFVVILIIFKILIVYADNVQIKLEGLNDVLRSHIESKLSSIRSNDIVIDQCFRNVINSVVYSGLRSSGYYSSIINFFLYPSSSDSNKQENYILVVRVNLGEPTKVSKVDVNSSGDISHDSDYQKLLIESQSYIGQILNHNKYDNFKNKLLNLSLSKGYFDFKFYDSKLIVIPASYKSFWSINFDSGQRYYFGDTHFYGGGLVKIEYLKNLFYVRSGMHYDNQLLIDCHRRLFATNWFHSVVISPNYVNSVNRTVKSIPLDVFLVPAITNNIEFDFGYSGDIGSRLKIVWKNPCINSYGHSFKNIFSFSLLEQYVDLNYKIPLVCSPLEKYYLLKGVIKHENICDTQSSFLVTMNVSRCWDSVIGWNRGINVNWCLNCCNELKKLQSMMLIYPGVSIHRIRQRGGMMPFWGDNQCYSMNISSDLWHSDVNFFFLQSRNIWIRTLLNNNRVIIRNNLGWMKCNDFQSIFSFIREFIFFNNYLIRGYKYQFLFFKNTLLDQLYVPSKFMFGSLEYQYNVVERWWGVFFVDAGNIVKNINGDFCFSFGTGVGVRWQSSIGPARLDFAVPLSCFNKAGSVLQLLHIYVGLGPEL